MEIVKKPWGHEKVFSFNQISTVKTLNVNPNQLLSLQKHKKRKEMWYFLTEGYVQLGKKKKKVKKGNVVIINKNTPHRLFAKNSPVSVLEISFGKFEWDDIIRLEDGYNRRGTTKK
jgi:mannose-6-phosphate isomerase-like protein (cupin superfamily)